MITAVLDACVLVPIVLADTLLRSAERDLFRPRWTEQILSEVQRNIPHSLDDVAAARRVMVMRQFFPEAMVTGHEPLINAMRNHPKDRHVLAAAVVVDADAIITANIRDFPTNALAPHAIEVLHPDDFLCALYDGAADELLAILGDQA